MSREKSIIRYNFSMACFKRDNYTCVKCGLRPEDPDAHHITDRKEMPGGGYVPENGITLCSDCHIKAEAFHQHGKSEPGYSLEELYAAIGSSKELAMRKSNECLEKRGRSN